METHFEYAVKIARQANLKEHLAAVLPVWAQWLIGQRRLDEASAALTEAKQLALAHGWDYILPETYTTQAQLALAEGAPQLAQERAEQAIAIAAELAQAVDEGRAWREKGKALAMTGPEREATQAFERSLALLKDQDPYEVRHTQMAWEASLPRAETPPEGSAVINESTRGI